jgi:hypothetical protein
LMMTIRRSQDNTNEVPAILGAGVMPGPGGPLGLSAKPPEQRALSRLPVPAGSRGAAPAYLVRERHKSANKTETQAKSPDDIAAIETKYPCTKLRSIRGTCAHGSNRWLYVRCKRRDCAGCSKVRQWQYASRIGAGIREMGWENCAFIVLTYRVERSNKPAFKKEAVVHENAFIRWLRNELKAHGSSQVMQYAKTWEIQPVSKRLHTNLAVGPWMKMDQKEMSRRWKQCGQVLASACYIECRSRRCRGCSPNGYEVVKGVGGWLSVEWIKNDAAVSREATKALSPDGLSTYLTKVEQMVPSNWHRAISFSKGFPKAAAFERSERVGEIHWESERQQELGAADKFQFEKDRGWWAEVEPGAGEYVDLINPENCRCYEWVTPDPPPETYFRPPDSTSLNPCSEIEARELVELLT